MEMERLKENLAALKAEVKSLQSVNNKLIDTCKLKGIDLPQDESIFLSTKAMSFVPSVYIETVIKERNVMLSENKELKRQISEMKSRADGEKHKISNLEAAEKRRKRILHYIHSKNLSSQYDLPKPKLDAALNLNSTTEVKLKPDHATGKNQRLKSLEALVEAIKAAPDISRALSLLIT